MGMQHKEKIDLMYDLTNIKNHLMQHPLYLVLIVAMVYGFYFLSFFLKNNWYLVLFTIFGWISLTAIIAMILAYLVLLLVRITDTIKKPWSVFPYLTIFISYGLFRGLFFMFSLNNMETIALLLMLLCTFIVTILLYKYKTNTFKTHAKMKHMEVEDGKKRPA